MIETLALVLVVFALCGLIGWLDWNNRKERSKLLNAIMAKTPEQMRDLDFVDKFQPAQLKSEKKDEDIIPTTQMSEQEFADFVGGKS